MYNFVFYFIYKSQLKDGPFVARYFATFVVAIQIFIQIGFLYSICRFVLCYNYKFSIALSDVKNSNFIHLVEFLGIALIMVILFKVYNKNKIEIIKISYEERGFHYSLMNIAKFILVIILPLIFAIILENNSLAYCS
jgi:hypothetical protein